MKNHRIPNPLTPVGVGVKGFLDPSIFSKYFRPWKYWNSIGFSSFSAEMTSNNQAPKTRKTMFFHWFWKVFRLPEGVFLEMFFCKKALKTKEKQAFSIRKYLEKTKKIEKLKELKINDLPRSSWPIG